MAQHVEMHNHRFYPWQLLVQTDISSVWEINMLDEVWVQGIRRLPVLTAMAAAFRKQNMNYDSKRQRNVWA